MNKYELAKMVFDQCSISTQSNCVRVVSMPEEAATMYWKFNEKNITQLFSFLTGCEGVRISLDLESCVIDFWFSNDTDIGIGAAIGTQAKVKPLGEIDISKVAFALDLDDTESIESFAEYVAEQLKSDGTVVKLGSVDKWNKLEKVISSVVARNPDIWEVVGPDEHEDVLYYNVEVFTRLDSLENYSVTIDKMTLQKIIEAIFTTESAGLSVTRYSKGIRLEFMIDLDSVYLDA